MTDATNRQVQARKIVGGYRQQNAVQATVIMAVALGAAMLVGLTGFAA